MIIPDPQTKLAPKNHLKIPPWTFRHGKKIIPPWPISFFLQKSLSCNKSLFQHNIYIWLYIYIQNYGSHPFCNKSLIKFLIIWRSEARLSTHWRRDAGGKALRLRVDHGDFMVTSWDFSSWVHEISREFTGDIAGYAAMGWYSKGIL